MINSDGLPLICALFGLTRWSGDEMIEPFTCVRVKACYQESSSSLSSAAESGVHIGSSMSSLSAKLRVEALRLLYTTTHTSDSICLSSRSKFTFQRHISPMFGAEIRPLEHEIKQRRP